MSGRLAALCLGLVVLGVAAAPAGAATDAERLADLADEVMCPVCGVPLDQAPDAPQAQRESELILALIRDGRSDDEIKAVLVAEYGEEVLATPEDEGFGLAAWVVPGAGIAAAALAIAIGVWRWRRRGSTEPPDASDEAGPTAADSDRLDADLARYEL